MKIHDILEEILAKEIYFKSEERVGRKRLKEREKEVRVEAPWKVCCGIRGK